MQPLLKLKHKLISLKEPLKEGSSSRLIVFDLDHTLISVASSYWYMKNLYERRLVSIKTVIKALLIKWKFFFSSMSLEELHKQVFDKMLKGFSLEALEAHVEEFLKQLLPKAIYEPAFNELKAAQERGDYIVLLSSAPDFLVRAFAKYFKIPNWDSTVYAVDKKRCLCNIAKLMVGSKKMQRLLEIRKRLGISKKQTVVYSDSHDDLPLFLQAGQPVAVNPDRRLAKIAKQLNWRVI
jgi:HAD superfamily hydrolase (TIGR01490 family)